MSDPQYQLKSWLAVKVDPRGVKSALAKAIGSSPDKITRSIELDDPDPKKRRSIKPHEIEAIARFFNELPPGYEGMTNWLRPKRLVDSYDDSFVSNDETDPDWDGSSAGFQGDQAGGFTREHWNPAVDGALPEIDVKLGAGSGVVGNVINLKIGASSVSAHPVVAEWLIPEEYLRNEAKASARQTLVMEVIGDSMTPTYQPGDRVMVDLAQSQMTTDTVYAISDGMSEPQIKRLQRIPFSDPPQVIIISDNPNLERFTVDLQRLSIIGRVCGHIARR